MTAKATIGAALIGALALILVPVIQNFLGEDDKSTSVSECNSSFKGISGISGGININNNCSKNYNPEYESEFNVEVERFSGRKINDVSFFSDSECKNEIPSKYDSGSYKIFQKMSVASGKFIYICKKGFEPFKLFIEQNQKKLKAKLKVICREPNSSPECIAENKQ